MIIPGNIHKTVSDYEGYTHIVRNINAKSRHGKVDRPMRSLLHKELQGIK